MTFHSHCKQISEGPGSLVQSPTQSVDSVDTYASTTASDEEADLDDDPEYYVPEPPLNTSWTSIPPTTSKDFASLFPSARRLRIRHDDATVDGNMNLRVDTTVRPASGQPYNTQLFHLRMHDLRTRSFSFRRYCRDSNREICHSHRKPLRVLPGARPTLQRSFSKTLSLFKHKNESKVSTSRRHDSGYGSSDEAVSTDAAAVETYALPEPPTSSQGPAVLSEHLSVEFSNYAHTEIRRRGTGSSKRYEFEYWGGVFAWKRSVRKDSVTGRAQYSYHLHRKGSAEAIAHLCETILSASEVHEEKEKGGWVAPSTLWISDQATIEGAADVCDAIVATGLLALADDSIRRTFHSKTSRTLTIPLPSLASLRPNKDHVEAYDLIDEAFHRDGTGRPRDL